MRRPVHVTINSDSDSDSPPRRARRLSTRRRRRPYVDAAGRDESIYLERLEHQVARGRCPADAIIERWIGDWHGDVHRLIEGSSYRIAA